jgi:hypothetical protein
LIIYAQPLGGTPTRWRGAQKTGGSTEKQADTNHRIAMKAPSPLSE